MISGMSGARMILFSLVLLLGGLLDTEAMPVKGVVGGHVTIKCSHSNANTNTKYFCKDPCKDQDVLIRSRYTYSNEKYSIKDNGNTFIVTIFRLTKEDTGTYWCGIDRVAVDTFNRVDLTVEPRVLEPTPEANTPAPPDSTTDSSSPNTPEPEDDDDDASTTDSSSPNTPEPDDDDNNGDPSTTNFSSQKLVYIVASLGVILLALAMVLLIFYRRRRRDVQASPGKDTDVVYASHSSQRPGRRIITSSMTANEREEPDSRSSSYVNFSNTQQHGSSDNIYSNMSVSSQDVFYATVSINKHNDGGGGARRPAAEVTYAAVRPKAPEDPRVYQVTSGF